MALIVALIGMLGSTITVVVGDYLQDQRRIAAERQSAYREFLQAAREFEDREIRTTTAALQDVVRAIASYSADPGGSQSGYSPASTVEHDAFESIWNAWAALEEKDEGIRLEGSPGAINSAGAVLDTALARWRYLIHISNLTAGDPSRITITKELRTFAATDFEDQPTAKPFWTAYYACRDLLEGRPDGR